MALTSEDIDVFILSYNRGDMIGHTIQSLLDQTIEGFRITVLDNASTDHTAEVVAAFNSPRIEFCTLPGNIGGLENLRRCQNLSTRKYMMVFHDDDQLHPEYLEIALQWLNQHPDVAVLIPNKINIEAGEKAALPKAIDRSAIKLDYVHFASALFVQNKLAFPGAIYATNGWNAIDIDGISKRFGKWLDRPIMIDALQKNQYAIILNGSWVFYGRHASQDTKSTQPHHAMWLNREAYYQNILGTSWTTFPGRCFCVMSPRNIKSGFKRRIARGPTFKEYLADAFKLGATSPRVWRFRFFTPKLVQKLFNNYTQSYFRKNFGLKQPTAIDFYTSERF